MKKTGRTALLSVIMFLLALTLPCNGENYRDNIHIFTSSPGDGARPEGNLLLSGSTLYGTAGFGGTKQVGIVFSMNTDGSNFKILHNFAGETDGAVPNGDLVLSGSTLYGTTAYGGGLVSETGLCRSTEGCGTIFSVNTDGSDYKLLYPFPPEIGGYPYSGLVLSGSTLYGTASFGGPFDWGTLFSIGTDGSNFKTLHSFGSVPYDGWDPEGVLTISADGKTLYGVTPGGGDWTKCDLAADYGSCGTVFSINTDGSDYKILHCFTGTTGGAAPRGGLIISGSTLYGTTQAGGRGCTDPNHMCGKAFSLSTDGTDFKILHSFPNNQKAPNGGLALSGSMLFGTTASGGGTACQNGKFGCGAIFSINTDGSDYKVLSAFGQSANDGSFPRGGVILSGFTLYGTTFYGGGGSGFGCQDGCGTVYSFDLPLPGLKQLHIAKTGTGSGMVKSDPGDINCGGACNARFIKGTVVTLTAIPDTGSVFKRWSGVSCKTADACRATMKSNLNIGVTFTKQQFNVKASISGGRGRVSPANKKVFYGDSASLSITPNKGYVITSITDNGEAKPLSNPYIIGSVTENHQIVIILSPDK